ncbi:MAG: family 65 glycosyl hydrolase [Butyrivibrio sp.]|nr:family 65 glycosyl hydrolase [Butyrivibrio sp.]
MRSNRVIVRKEKFDNDSLRLNETLFCNANGYIGIRGTLEEGVPVNFSTMRGMYLGGVYEIIPMKQAESLCNLIEKKQTMLNVADTQTIYMYVDGERFDMSEGTLLSNERVLNMDEGYTERRITWKSPKKKTVEISVKRVAHLSEPNLFTIEYRVKPVDFEGEIAFESIHTSVVKNYSDPTDPRLAAESPTYLFTENTSLKDGITLCVSRTKVSNICVASAVTHKGYVMDDTGNITGLGPFDHSAKAKGTFVSANSVKVKKNHEVVLIKYTALADSLKEKDPAQKAVAVLKDATGIPLIDLYFDQKCVLSKFWNNAGMEIEGDEELNLAMCFNMYELFISSPRQKGVSIAAKGLSGEGYEGHYFWDTEMYMLPFFILTDPESAKRILSYRYETLGKAKENAALLGHKKGALYPWRTITGEECSGYFPSGTAAYHINGAITRAIVEYYLTTHDEEFILTKGAEILIETARLWRDVGNYDRKGRFVINEVTGPDEYTCMVDNNYYTNVVAAHGMKWAVKLIKRFSDRNEIANLMERLDITNEELDSILEAAENIYLPYDEELGITPQDDSFLQKPVWDLENTDRSLFPLLLHFHPLHLYRYQVCKQADTVLAHFLFPEYADKDTMEKSFRYYEKITTHDSSLSTCAFSMQASRLGLYKEAEKYFGDSAKLDLYNMHGNTKDGVHTANMGGAYMAIVYGFAGVRISEEGLSVDPFLPGMIKGYNFNFTYLGKRIRLEVSDSQMSVKLLEGDTLDFFHAGEKYSLAENGVTMTWILKQ